MDEAEPVENTTEHENSDLEDAFVLDVVEVLEENDSDSSNFCGGGEEDPLRERDPSCEKDPLSDNDLLEESSTHALTEVYNRKRKNNGKIASHERAQKNTESDDTATIEEHSLAKIRKKNKASFPCETCDLEFSEKYKYDVHLRTIHNVAESETYKENTFPHNLRSQRLRQNYLKNVLHSVTKPPSQNVSKSSAQSNEHKMQFVCEECGSKFRKNNTLENHVKKVHAKPSQKLPKKLKSFECAECGNGFTKKHNLIIHLRTIHKQTCLKTSSEKRFTCPICQKGFSHNYNLKVHLRTIHKLAEVELKKEKPFMCSLCPKYFGRKHTLKVHFSTVHGLELEPKKEKNFHCPTCHKLFSRKPNLLRHSLMKHPQSADLKCLTCGRKFLTEEEIRDHVEQCSRKHAIKIMKSERIKNRVIQQTVVCALCQLTLHKIADMRLHYQNDHNLDMSSNCLTFSSDEEFLAWKYEEETNNRCSYSRYRSYNIQRAKYVDFFCSRSGFYKDKNQGLRGRRAIGSKKINACCPAQIKVKYLDDEVTVKYLPTHVGHDNKLCYMNLTQVEREIIIEELRKGIAPQKILEKVKYPLPASEDERRKIHLLTVQDIRNIAVTAGLDYKKGRYREEKSVEDISTWVEEHLDSVLHYKAKGQLDEDFPSLKSEEFLLIVMTEKQRCKLEQLGREVVLVDSTNWSEKSDFVLTTMMVLDSNDESYACCFMFSSKMNDELLNIFYESIRKSILEHSLEETWKTRTFMSGLRDCYYSSWIKVFPAPEFRLFCPWHVLKNWRDNLNKITVNNIAIDIGMIALDDLRKLKNEVYKFLKFDLMEQRDLQTFHAELNTFLEIDNPALSSFQTFFKDTYFPKKEMWAYCYREMAGIKPRSFTESFQKILKYQHTTGNKVRQLNQALAAVVSYMEKKNEAEIVREEKGVQELHKLRTLRRRHINSLKSNKLSITSLGPNEWLVPSGSSKNEDELCESYYIKKRDNECVNCYLTCRECGVCLHDFECTCTDYCIFNNMCKHIHLLCQSEDLLLPNIDQMNDSLADDSMQEEEVILDFDPENEEIEYEIINPTDVETMKDEEPMDELVIKEEVDLKDELDKKDVSEIIASQEESTEVKEQFNKVISGISSSPQMLNVAKKWVQQFTSIITACEKQNQPDTSVADMVEETSEVST